MDASNQFMRLSHPWCRTMKVIIVGAGEVGRASAETISNIHDVLVVEKDENVLNVLKSRLNVSTLKADGTNPKTIKYAIENHEADMIIATLGTDSANTRELI